MSKETEEFLKKEYKRKTLKTLPQLLEAYLKEQLEKIMPSAFDAFKKKTTKLK